MDLIEIQEAITNDLEDIDNFYELIKLSLTYINDIFEKNLKTRRPLNHQIVTAIFNNLSYHYDNKDGIFNVKDIIDRAEEIDRFIIAKDSSRVQPTRDNLRIRYSVLEDDIIKLLRIIKKSLDNNSIIYRNNFDTSNAVEKIEEAIYIIDNCFEIDDKIKKTIIRNLEKTIKALESKKYTRFYGHIKETLTILAAFGSIASGVAGVQQIKETVFDTASESLNECIEIVEQEIININIENEQYFIQPKTLNKLLTGQKENLEIKAEIEE